MSRNCFNSLKKLEDNEFIDLENNLNNHLNNNNQEENQQKNSEENLDLEYLKILNLKGLILLENGYFTKSSKFFNSCKTHLNRICSNSYHPLVLNNKLDEIYSHMYSTQNFGKMKENILRTIAKAKMIENNYLIFKGYIYLSLIYMNSGNHRTSKALIDHAYSNLNSSNKSEFLNSYIYHKFISLYISTLRKFKNDKILKNFEEEIKRQNLILISRANSKENISDNNDNNKNNKNNNNEKEKEREKNVKIPFSELEIFALRTYYETNYSINMNTLNKNLSKINEAIYLLEKNDFSENSLALLYLKKWAFEVIIGREATSNHYLDESQKIIKNSYMSDSIKNIEFLRALIINSLNIYPPKIDIAMEILRKTKNVSEEVNCNSVLQKFFNIVINVRSERSNVSEIFNLYEDFLTNNTKYFNKDSEVAFDLKEILKSSKMGFVYKNKKEV